MKEGLKVTIKEIGNCIKKDSKIAIFGHVNPDGDAVGSTLGLYHYLKYKVADVQVIMPNDFPDFLKW
ncbi:MAG: DHH family phosphoesterase, partial [Bacteroidales bacterium]|nr:DHH family phosphoesterase [Bacteroidales bacterium]